MARLNYILRSVMILYGMSVATLCWSEKEDAHAHKRLFVFGDSLFDPGNNKYLNKSEYIPADYWPYGMTLNNHSTGRFSDGLLVPDFIALQANLHIAPPFLQPGAKFYDGANFASAGSGVLDNHPGVMNLRAQVSNFKRVAKLLTRKLGGERAKEAMMRSVYLFSMGGNDYFSFATDYPQASRSDVIQFVGFVIGNFTTALKDMYEVGARKLAFQNVAPIGCVPSVKQTYNLSNSECAELPLELAKLHNKELSSALQKLESELEGFKYSIFDYYTELADRINDPSKYGFKVGDIACCGSGNYRGTDCGTEPYELCKNPYEYVFFDGDHTTQHTNSQLATLLWNAIPNVTSPYTTKQLFQLP